jgi:glutaredoxin
MMTSRDRRAAPWPVAGAALLLLSSCHRPPLTAAQADAIHQSCDRRITLRPSPSIGLLPEAPVAPPRVVIYGASWCGACDAAAFYLGREGIPFEEKDVEADVAASAERSSLLARAALPPTGALPVVVSTTSFSGHLNSSTARVRVSSAVHSQPRLMGKSAMYSHHNKKVATRHTPSESTTGVNVTRAAAHRPMRDATRTRRPIARARTA